MDTADRTAIENLIFRYARYVDTAQYEALGELFAAASITANKTDAPLVGATVISEYWRSINKRYDCGTPRTHHAVRPAVLDLIGVFHYSCLGTEQRHG